MIDMSHFLRFLTFDDIDLCDFFIWKWKHRLMLRLNGLKDLYSSLWKTRRKDTERHLAYGVIVSVVTNKWTLPALILAKQAGTWFTYPAVMAGWVDLCVYVSVFQSFLLQRNPR